MFVDHIKIHAKAGDGGDGAVSFRREKFVPKGGPDGGDGGDGGDIVLLVDHHTDNLKNFFFRPNHKADAGRPGGGQRKSGKKGRPLVLKVPPGTVVYSVEPPKPKHSVDDEWGEGEEWIDDEGKVAEVEVIPEEQDYESEPALAEVEGEEEQLDITTEEDAGELVADLTEYGEKFTLCVGGKGGKGNFHFKTSTNQAPIEAVPGTKGTEGWFYLELRRIADVGLVGFPNAGKSTLLCALSNASPKVAAYPFTTLKPMVGVVDFPGFNRCTIADIPGLIEGAHENIGLGHEFLRHIMRCRVLMFVVDTAAVDQRDPITDLQILRKEIKMYDEDLSKRPWFIVANKLDIEGSDVMFEAIKQRFPKVEVLGISADTGEGLDILKERLHEMVGHRPT